jgi:hypothetical protein
VNLTYRTATTTTGTPASGVFYSSIIGRAPIVDFSNDLRPRMGVERVIVQQIQEVQGESGPNGERVWKPINDQFDAVRLVGNWSNIVSSYGSRAYTPNTPTSSDYFEITFYGTGLNLLQSLTANTTSATYSVNGGSATSFWPSVGSANPLGARNYSANLVIPVLTGLTLGIYTVKIVATSAIELDLNGYEILNEASTIKTASGTSSVNGKLLTLSSLDSQAYNTTFDAQYQNGGTSPSDLTRGGHVVVYQKTDGTIGKSVTWTNTAAAYLSSANHANESVIRTYHWREFGCGRNTVNAGQTADDFSSLTTTASNRAFTLDDGTTTLVSNSVSTTTTNEFILNGGFHTFTFVGTGLDIAWSSDFAGTNTNANAFEVFIDGVSQGNWDTVSAGNTVVTVKKIVSGLPYGTHTVKILRNTPNIWTMAIKQFIVYGPAKPAIPSGAIELSDYYLMANYVDQGTAGTNFIATGVLGKAPTREFLYGSTAAASTVTAAYRFGFGVQLTTLTTSFAQYTFFGTGATITQDYNAGTGPVCAVLVDGSTPGGTVTALGGTYSAGNWTNTTTNGILRISGLSLGLHTVKITWTVANGAGYVSINGIDVITPIHAPKNNNLGALQNTLPIGNCAISDNRQFNAQQVPTQKAWGQAVGIASNPTISSPAATFIPIPDMSLTLTTKGNPVHIAFDGSFFQSTTSYTSIYVVYVDGIQVGKDHARYTQATNATSDVSINMIVPLAAGTHKIEVYWWNENVAMTTTASASRRNLMAREL